MCLQLADGGALGRVDIVTWRYLPSHLNYLLLLHLTRRMVILWW